MRHFTILLCFLGLTGCSSFGSQSTQEPTSTKPSKTVLTPTNNQSDSTCLGNALPPGEMVNFLQRATNEGMLQRALGVSGEGGLCEGQVYVVTQAFTVYRVWNSTNADSELGNWWSFFKPEGAISDYRKNFNICYENSPLDVLTACEIKAGSDIVIGPGQSNTCGEWLTHPVSKKKQIYLEGANTKLVECKTYQGHFQWRQ